jgi:anti-sigma regulatory factor (Ser/Thr protein kinase)
MLEQSLSETALHTFRHEALFYAGEEDFLARTVPFLRDGAVLDEPAMVAVGAGKIAALQAELGEAAGSVHFVDMGELGRNPARIIPAWRDFVSNNEASGSPMRGIGEPIWAGRSAAELVECQRHESLLNLAFAKASAFRLLCPYDTRALEDDVLAEAKRSHPLISENDVCRQSNLYLDPEVAPGPFDGELPPPARVPLEVTFASHDLRRIRDFVGVQVRTAGLSAKRAADVVLAVSELATNSVLHGGGSGTLRVWWDADDFVCEIHDGGEFHAPLVGRERPTDRDESGRGLWLVNHLCDLVQLRSLPSGNVVRVHMKFSA